MKVFNLLLFAAVVLTQSAIPVRAHGDEPHPKCKKGYVLTDDHRCVKALPWRGDQQHPLAGAPPDPTPAAASGPPVLNGMVVPQPAKMP